ncbi:MAG: DUF1501 domain-containing protein [Bermanella sp.]
MLRRNFLKLSSAVMASPVIPVSFGVSAMAQKAHADSPNYAAVNVEAPAVMPQVINIFMYGGASELAGNLSNIEDISAHSVTAYDGNGAFRETILQAATDNDPDRRSRFTDGQITANKFWKEAGGTHMEDMLAAGDMTVYRTIYKQKSPTRSHRESIFMFHKGTLDIENAPGVGSRLALMMMQNRAAYEGARLADGTAMGSLDELTLPFVSFEGDSQTYAIDPNNPLPLYLRGLTMDNQFNNPYSRGSISSSESAIESLLQNRLDLVKANKSMFQKAWDGFDKRNELQEKMADLSSLLNGTDDNGGQSSAEALGVGYPNTSFARQLEAAVTLAIHNPQTLYMAVGTPGLGGWDDHNNGVDRYPNRMNDLMESIKAGMAHIKAAAAQGVTTINNQPRTQTDNIIINVFGDFGRLVNLNNSNGWDHANNQNLYTFGGAGVRPAKEKAALGTVVGTTVRAGKSKTNNQYTMPTKDVEGVPDSPTWEPMSIASSIYGYFGATNPQVLTASAGNPEGDVRLEDKL